MRLRFLSVASFASSLHIGYRGLPASLIRRNLTCMPRCIKRFSMRNSFVPLNNRSWRKKVAYSKRMTFGNWTTSYPHPRDIWSASEETTGRPPYIYLLSQGSRFKLMMLWDKAKVCIYPDDKHNAGRNRGNTLLLKQRPLFSEDPLECYARLSSLRCPLLIFFLFFVQWKSSGAGILRS